MTFPALSTLVNHLWQSSLCAAAIWLLTLALKKNRAALRYWLWLAASVKFLLPFSLLVGLGGHLGWRVGPVAVQPQWIFPMMYQLNRTLIPKPAPAQQALTLPLSSLTPTILFVVWIIGVAVSLLLLLRSSRQIRTALCRPINLPCGFPIPVLSFPNRLEPGVFGIRKPVLLLPEGITERLSPEQLDAILAHELCHVRRRDNLTAAIHLVSETIFWFFPLLWWIRARLVEEREHACDEEVLRSGAEPRTYAEGILKVCEFYLESPTVCLSGVTGANLKQRIESIMMNQIRPNLNAGKKLLLAAAAFTTLAAPLLAGIINASPVPKAQSLPQPKFDVASIKLSPHDAGPRILIRPMAGGITITNIPAEELIILAYRIQRYQLAGGPSWTRSDRYDISAKSDNLKQKELSPDDVSLRLQSLLADRFHLAFHRETKQLPVYNLVIARKDGKLGPKLVEAKGNNCTAIDPDKPPPPPDAEKPPVLYCGGMMMGGNALTVASMQIGDLLQNFSRLLERTVVDKTGLTGKYDVNNMVWTPDEPQGPPGSEPGDPAFTTALQEQLGLKLVAQKGPVDTVVIDKIERPSEN